MNKIFNHNHIYKIKNDSINKDGYYYACEMCGLSERYIRYNNIVKCYKYSYIHSIKNYIKRLKYRIYDKLSKYFLMKANKSLR